MTRDICEPPTVSPWTYEETYRQGRSRHYSLRFDGRVQPFGAIFYNKVGDLLPLVRAAVKELNRAAAAGDDFCEIVGAYYRYRVSWEAEYTTQHGQVQIERC